LDSGFVVVAGWSQHHLAAKAGVGTVAIHQLENGTSQPRQATLDVIRRALKTAGVQFIDENGGGA
jgi:transcriptional regulator with XRE-family HTH domain